ncbi:MAG: hypothetical protein IPL35_14040 [Sphingobacteriales bacterium]|nr:hypothetical protein [Sphingobacteriales bacterium]
MKKIILILLLLGILGGTYYGYAEFNREAVDVSKAAADLNISSTDLVAAYSNDETKANTDYLNKTIAVQGTVKNVSKDDKGVITLELGDPAEISSVSCQMDERHNESAASIKPGDNVKVKGICTGMLTDVVLVRCALEK